MKLHELKYTDGAKHAKKRVGRGNGSGYGKTATRGENGQNSRSGGGVRPGFEGGQNPLYRRLPKRGFSNHPFKKEFVILNVQDLNQFEDGTVVSEALLKENGIVKNLRDGVKILGNGELNKKLTVKVAKVSKTAKELIEKNGGQVEGR
ncbi:MAG: 50S ribosomal protein L15 [Mycoplasmatales bacterium]